MIICINHKKASERLDVINTPKKASERLDLINTVQAKRSAVIDNQQNACVSERRDITIRCGGFAIRRTIK